MMSRLPTGLVVLVALGSAVSVAVAAMPVLSRLSAADRVWAAVTHPAPQTDPALLRADLSPIMDFAPFGRAVLQTDNVEAPDAAAPSALILQGISASPVPANSRAIIAKGEGQNASYAIGDKILPGIVLTAIATDHVSLDDNGATLRLDFPTIAAAAPGNAAETPGASTDLQHLIPIPQAGPAGLDETITALRDEIQRNPQAVLDRYGITASGEGYLIGNSTPASLLQIGLQQGDLISEVNGRKVGAILADRGFLDEVAAAGQAEIVVLRDGRPVALSVPFQ